MVQANAEFTFTDYEVRDADILLHFVCCYPGPGEVTDYYIAVTDTEVSGANTEAKLRTLIINKLQRKIRAVNIADKLDLFIGKGLVI